MYICFCIFEWYLQDSSLDKASTLTLFCGWTKRQVPSFFFSLSLYWQANVLIYSWTIFENCVRVSRLFPARPTTLMLFRSIPNSLSASSIPGRHGNLLQNRSVRRNKSKTICRICTTHSVSSWTFSAVGIEATYLNIWIHFAFRLFFFIFT